MACRASPFGQREHAQDADFIVKWKSDHVSDTYALVCFFHTFAIEAHVPGIDQRLRERAALHQPDAVKITVDAQSLALQLRERGKDVGRVVALALLPLTASAPAPGFAGLGEADIAHQPAKRLLVETD